MMQRNVTRLYTSLHHLMAACPDLQCEKMDVDL